MSLDISQSFCERVCTVGAKRDEDWKGETEL